MYIYYRQKTGCKQVGGTEPARYINFIENISHKGTKVQRHEGKMKGENKNQRMDTNKSECVPLVRRE
jgi:hypothetical protein